MSDGIEYFRLHHSYIYYTQSRLIFNVKDFSIFHEIL